MEQQTISLQRDEMEGFARSILECLPAALDSAQVLALHGDLGAGKTTLVQMFGKLLGITEPLTSPTFTIMKQYEVDHAHFDTLIHMDAYRIEDINELRPLNFAEILSTPRTLICIEWAEKIAPALPSDIIHISLEISDDERRIVQVS